LELEEEEGGGGTSATAGIEGAGCGLAGKSTVNSDWQFLQRPRMLAEPEKRLSSSEYLVRQCGHWTIIRPLGSESPGEIEADAITFLQKTCPLSPTRHSP
jgi:hypothetical protein